MGTHLQSLKSNLQSIRVCVRTMLRLQSSLIRLQPALFQQSTCLASLHTSAALDTKRHIVLQRRRRKRLRLKKLNNRFADVTEGQRETKERWTKERMMADLEQVWRENGLNEEPPILSVDKKRELMVRWFKEGKLYSVMGHDELVDYNLNTPIQVAPDKLQPKVWYMNENTPRHDNKIHFSGDIMKRMTPGEKLRSGEKTATELLSELKLTEK